MLKHAAPRPHFGRTVTVEFRKLFSTVPQRILALSVVAATLLVAVALLLEYEAIFGGPMHWLAISFIVRMPAQYLLPPLIILLVTTEWGTRSAMTTFTLVPRRGQVVLAKGIVAFVASSVTWLLTSAVAIGANAIAFQQLDYPTAALWMPAADVAREYLGFMILMASAFAIALLIHNTAAAIAVVLVVPIITQIAVQLGGFIARVAEWINISALIQQILLYGETGEWPKLVVASAVWVLAPLVAGIWWTMRREAA